MSHTHYDHQIRHLREDLLHLGNVVEITLNRVVKSLATNDNTTATWIIHDSVQIDYARSVVEEQAIALLAPQQPDTKDLRFLNIVTAIAIELGRIGDYVRIIAHRVERIATRPKHVTASPALYEMAYLTQWMLQTSLAAFFHQDIDRTSSLKQDDSQVNDIETRLRTDLIDQARQDPESIESVVDLLDVIYALKRVANRAISIGDRVSALISGTSDEANSA